MRKSFLLCFFLSVLPFLVFPADLNESSTEHYHIRTSYSPQYTAQLGLLMEELYSRFTRFTGEPSVNLPALYVTELSSSGEWSDFLGISPRDERNCYSLVRQGESGQGEIVFYDGDRERTMVALIQLALFQYLEACNSESPFWIKSGLSRYFETFASQERDTADIPFNWSAYEDWTALGNEQVIPAETLLNLPEEEAVDNRSFQTSSWALVNYLIQAPGQESRLLWETISMIRTGRKGEWINSVDQDLDGNIVTFMAGVIKPESDDSALKSLYDKGDRDGVLSYLYERDLNESWLGYYYTGLIHYDRGLFTESLSDFIKAEEAGAPQADVWFSRGLCLWQLGERSEAERLLKKAETLKEGIIPEELSRLLD